MIETIEKENSPEIRKAIIDEFIDTKRTTYHKAMIFW